MLVQCDKAELGDKRLNPEEAVYREREDLLRLAARKKIGGQDELEDPERAFGPKMSFGELIARLQRIVPELKARDGSAGNIALYYPRNGRELDEVIKEGTASADEFFIFHKYVGGFPKQDIPEYSYIDIDSSHLPTREHRGWRSVLIPLLKQGIVSYKRLIMEFGEATGSRSWRWFQQTQPWRNNPHSIFAQSSIAPSGNQ